MKNVMKAIVLSLLTFFCVGCANVDYTMTINKDDSATLEYFMKISENEIDLNKYSEILDSIIKELETNGFEVERNEKQIKAIKYINNVLELDEFDSLIKPNDAKIIGKEEGFWGNDYVFDAVIDLTGYSNTAKELKFDNFIKENVEIRFNLNLPSKAKKSNITQEKSKNLTWKLNYGEENFIEAEYSVFNVEIVVILSIFVVVFILIIFFVKFYIKKKETIKF